MAFIPEIGDNFSGCEILARCGRGAFGITFLAQNPLGKKVIIKIISSAHNCIREMRGLRNYMSVAGKQENLLQIYHIGEFAEGFYYIMEAADNCGTENDYMPATLGNFFRINRKFSAAETIDITRQLLSGLKVIHENNLIHRDIKPDNIIFVNGKPKLSDPGLVVEVGQSASFAGTLGFIPPEALDDEEAIDQRADLYALGKVFYCMATGCKAREYPLLPTDMPVEICRQFYPLIMRVCNRDRNKRFRNCDDFMHNLPVKIANANILDKLRENFRAWKMLHSRQWQLICRSAVIAAVLLLITSGAVLFAGAHRSAQQTAWQAGIERFKELNQSRMELVDLQLQAYLPETVAEYRNLRAQFNLAYQQQRFADASALANKLQDKLAAAAEKLLPAPAASNANFEKSIAYAGAMHGFLSSPLAEYLSKQRHNELQTALKNFEKQLYENWQGPRCDREWNNFQESAFPMIFVPPGALKVAHSNVIRKIPYHYWICKHEILSESFNFKLNIAPQKSPYAGTPVERIVWNDLLYYCYLLTMELKLAEKLPPGYIVRLPNELEWEFALNNGWLGQDTAPLSERANLQENSAGRTWPPGRKLANKLGLWDMHGNVAEIVQKACNIPMQNAAVVRGGSFRKNEKSADERIFNLKYQCIPFDIGSRLVIAPGSMDYFDREFFLYGATQVRTHNKVYELIGANNGAFNGADAEKLCALLGGRLGEFEDEKHLHYVRKNMALLGEWPTFIGSKKINGKWVWASNHQTIDFGHWQKKTLSAPGKYLVLHGNYWDTVGNQRLPVFLCEWDLASFEKRNEQLRNSRPLPMELTRFSWQDRTFLLIDSSMLWYAAARFCELLGGRLAVLDNPELQKIAAEKLANFKSGKILLGGYAKRDKWYWLNGSEINLPLKKDPRINIPSRNRNFVTMGDGGFYNSQFSDLFLCELPASSLSPR